MTETLLRARAARALAALLTTSVLALAPAVAFAHDLPTDASTPSPASVATLDDTREGGAGPETSNAAEENDPFAADGYLDELLIGSAAAVAVLLLGAFLMRRA